MALALTETRTVPTAAGIYCRISEDRTGQGLGVARQEADCRAWADRHGWTVAEVYCDDDISAYSGKRRPAYHRLLDDIAAGRRDGLIVWHPDRLHRSPAELETFIDVVERTGIAVGTVTAGDLDLATATGRMTARIVGAVARHESDHKSERIRRKHLELAQNGRVPGGGQRPFGYETDRVTIREDEAELIREAAARVLAGDGVRTIAREWQEAGVPTVTGARWSATTVKRLLASGRICGWREHHGVLTAEAEWPAILDAATGARLRRLLADPARNLSGGANARSYLLSGLVRCGRCGARMTAAPVVRKGGRYRRYACLKDRGGCNRCGIGAEPLEELIVEAVLLRLDGAALASTVAEHEKRIVDRSEVAVIEERLAELADAFAAGEISRPEWLRARQGLDGRLEAARAADAADVRRSAATAVLAEEGPLRSRWPSLTMDRKRLVLETVIEAVTIAPTSRAANYFDAGRVDVTWRA